MPVAANSDHWHDRPVTFSASRVAAWFCGAGGIALAVSLFLDWSQWVNPFDAWRLFAALDVLLALCAALAVAAAFVPRLRLPAAACSFALIVALTVHFAIS